MKKLNWCLAALMLFSLLPYPAYIEVKAEEKTTAEELLDAALETPPEIVNGKL